MNNTRRQAVIPGVLSVTKVVRISQRLSFQLISQIPDKTIPIPALTITNHDPAAPRVNF